MGWLGLARLVLAVVPFRTIAARLGRLGAEPAYPAQPEKGEELRLVSSAIRTAARHLPGTYQCLPQALAAQRMLHRRRIASTLCFGVGRQEEGLAFHAWVKHAQTFVTGAFAPGSYQVLATFVSR